MPCPRCARNNMINPIERNYTSRRDNKTYICDVCSIEESLIDCMAIKKTKNEKRFKEKINKKIVYKK